MREIKFRAWNKTVNKFTYFGKKEPIITSAEVPNGKSVGMFLAAEKEIYLTPYEAPQQFIGIRDKNEKEIYDGDIVKAWSQGYCGIFQIKWREDGGGSPCYILYPAYQNKEMWYISASREADGHCYDRGLEVIGNIYKNPELLEG